jgi:1-deoxy-D-xylulose-5-phosphate synthase
MTSYPLLDRINSPGELRDLKRQELLQLANELRDFIVQSVASTGGHFSSNLGTIELTIALHYVFNTPFDRLVWDVGHQAYPHKILTGRRAGMAKLRQRGGIAGFPRRDESEYDTFGVAHSSTSISAALGIAVAAKRERKNRKVVAIIGDGAMSAGLAFEALNNAGSTHADMLVILNDNDMSISRPVGALEHYFAKLLSGKFCSSLREGGDRLLRVVSPIREFAKRAEQNVKGMMTSSTFFEEFDFNYIGPIDGHDLDILVSTLANVSQRPGLQFLHIVTKKGKGYLPAEADPILYHGPSKFDPTVGIFPKPVTKPTYSQIFGEWLCDMAEHDERLVGITPAMCEGSGMVEFSKRFPDRYFDVGIAEQHAVTFAAGLACEDLKPVVAIYSTFLQRAYDQVIHDVAIQNLPVVFAIDRAGLVGADGPTHAGSFDFSYLRCIPNMAVMAPSNENECRQMLYTAFSLNTPTAVRYPSGSGTGIAIEKTMAALPIGKGVVRRKGKHVAILAFGSLVSAALSAAEKLNATVADMRFVKPLDEDLILRLANQHDLLVTVEENTIHGGAGTAVLEYLSDRSINIPTLVLGLPDRFIDHGDPGEMLAECGLHADGIARSINKKLKELFNELAIAVG